MPSNLIANAREIANQKRKSDEEKSERNASEKSEMRRQVTELRGILLTELKKLNREKTAHGSIKLELSEDPRVDAYLHVGKKKMAWFKVSVYHGVFEHDECEDMPYTEPQIKGRFYPPDPNPEYWDIEETLGSRNGGEEETCNNSPDQMARFFERMAAHLSKWV